MSDYEGNAHQTPDERDREYEMTPLWERLCTICGHDESKHDSMGCVFGECECLEFTAEPEPIEPEEVEER